MCWAEDPVLVVVSTPLPISNGVDEDVPNEDVEVEANIVENIISENGQRETNQCVNHECKSTDK